MRVVVNLEVSVKIAFTKLAVVAARLKYAEVVSNATLTKSVSVRQSVWRRFRQQVCDCVHYMIIIIIF